MDIYESIHRLRADNATTPIEKAVWLAGGPTKVSHLCGVSWHTVRKWRKRGWVETARCAVLLSEATGGKVTVKQLAGPLQRVA